MSECCVCTETVVDDRFGECVGCRKPFHLYGVEGGVSRCGEDHEDGPKCRDCGGRTIVLKVVNHTLVLNVGAPGCGAIDTDLHEDGEDHDDYNMAIDGLESLILAHACAGVDVEDPRYVEGVGTAIEAIVNNT